MSQVEGVVSVYRNRAALPEDKRPAVYVLDGDEENNMPDKGTNRGRGPDTQHTYFIALRPEIHVALDQRLPMNIEVGEDLSDYLAFIQHLVTNDEVLNDLVTRNGDIVYQSCRSDLAIGRDMRGQLQINFAIVYPAMMSQLHIQ